MALSTQPHEEMRRLLLAAGVKKHMAEMHELIADVRLSEKGEPMLPIRRVTNLLFKEKGFGDYARKTTNFFSRSSTKERLAVLGDFARLPCPSRHNKSRAYEYATLDQTCLFLVHIAPGSISMLRTNPDGQPNGLPVEASRMVADVIRRCANVGQRLRDLVEQAVYDAGMCYCPRLRIDPAIGARH